MNKKVIFREKEVEITYKGISVGSKFPDFKAVTKELKDFRLSDLKNNVLVINSFPSIDTGICALQTIKFNNEVKKFDNVSVITVSKDLPFALYRFCAEKTIENAITVSDYKYRDFENNIGGLILEVGLLTRQVFVVDKNGIVRYIEIVESVHKEPNYDNVLNILKDLI